MSKPPIGWDRIAHASWLAGRNQDAVRQVLARLNAESAKPIALQLQFAYYLFLNGDPASAAQVLERAYQIAPDNNEVLRNLSVCLSRSGQYERALPHLLELARREPQEYLAQDALCISFAKLGDDEKAVQAGNRSLQLKDAASGTPVAGWALPTGHPTQWLAQWPTRQHIIAFSLWGSNPRYLRGALDNVLAANYLYPEWRLRFYVDDSVPAELVSCLEQHGAQVLIQPAGQSLRQRLCWRFLVANDPSVGRFLIRDADSVFTLRERLAVEDWLTSDRWFHVMRDWWSHTDLVLAGMWGGIAGIVPPLAPLIT
ncbi:MAG: tetratricopeptide repeat protein, partial [Aeromonas sp.]